jgi:hypothetical protein
MPCFCYTSMLNEVNVVSGREDSRVGIIPVREMLLFVFNTTKMHHRVTMARKLY